MKVEVEIHKTIKLELSGQELQDLQKIMQVFINITKNEEHFSPHTLAQHIFDLKV